MLDAAFEKGVRRFDLARTYGMGESERIFGEWLTTRNIDRRDIDLITKGGIGMDRYGDPDRPLLTQKDLAEEVEISPHTPSQCVLANEGILNSVCLSASCPN